MVLVEVAFVVDGVVTALVVDTGVEVELVDEAGEDAAVDVTPVVEVVTVSNA